MNCEQRANLGGTERGFTLLEVLISMAITLIVMGAVFGLLTRGQRSFQREPQVADLQQSARTTLDMVTKDILQAGSGLPPEFPAFSRINGAGNQAPTDVIEVIGAFQSAGNVFMEPEEVFQLNGSDVLLVSNTTNLEINDMVVVYNNAPNVDPAGTGRTPQWALAQVAAVVEDPFTPTANATVTLNYGAYAAAYSNHAAGAGNPPNPADFAAVPPIQIPKIARVSVVRYFTQLDNPANYNGPPPQVLMRDVDFQNNPQPVGYLEDFQVQYVIGVQAPALQDNPPDPVVDLAGVALTAENMLSSVRLSVTARSVSAGMEGATEGASAARDDNFIRKTFSTNVNPRNLSAGLDMRALTTP
jgi:prepilin-type N-terminal cleavage/methylation domain-containing protein